MIEPEYRDPLDEIERLQAEVERLSILVGRCNCLSMEEYTADLNTLRQEEQSEF